MDRRPLFPKISEALWTLLLSTMGVGASVFCENKEDIWRFRFICGFIATVMIVYITVALVLYLMSYNDKEVKS